MPPSQAIALQIDRLSREFSGQSILSEISLCVKSGEITCLLGESGCGKSTLLGLLSGIDRPDRGSISVYGTEIAGPNVFIEPENRRIGHMFQEFALFPHLTVADNLAFGLRTLPKAEQQARIDEVVTRIGISHLMTRYPGSLSGGEQQRVALARALAPRPAILLMDEPFSNLDQGLRQRIRRETVQTLRELGTTAIIVTHDPQEALAVGDVIVLMKKGKIEQIGTPFDIYDRPCSIYAAEFMGPCNRLTGIWRDGHIETPIGAFPAKLDIADGSLALACVRPQALSIGPDGEGISARVLSKTFIGESEQIEISVHPLSEPLRMHSHVRIPMRVGEKVSLQLNGAQVHVFSNIDGPTGSPDSLLD